MADVFTKKKRSWMMSRVHGKDTKPELIVRRILYSLGYRYRLHGKDLPGCPDIILPKHRRVIFVNGCFWHGHVGCDRAKRPSTNKTFWDQKIDRNVTRDQSNITKLRNAGWDILTVWQCETKNTVEVTCLLNSFLTLSVMA